MLGLFRNSSTLGALCNTVNTHLCHRWILQHLFDAVEERCEAIKAAADEAVAKLMQQLKMQLLLLPKKVRTLPYHNQSQYGLVNMVISDHAA